MANGIEHLRPLCGKPMSVVAPYMEAPALDRYIDAPCPTKVFRCGAKADTEFAARGAGISMLLAATREMELGEATKQSAGNQPQLVRCRAKNGDVASPWVNGQGFAV